MIAIYGTIFIVEKVCSVLIVPLYGSNYSIAKDGNVSSATRPIGEKSLLRSAKDATRYSGKQT